MISASSVCAVLAGLSVLSEDVRIPLTRILSGDQAGDLSSLVLRGRELSHVFGRAALEYASANRPMVGFGLVAVVLAFLMFKT